RQPANVVDAAAVDSDVTGESRVVHGQVAGVAHAAAVAGEGIGARGGVTGENVVHQGRRAPAANIDRSTLCGGIAGECAIDNGQSGVGATLDAAAASASVAGQRG